MNITRHLFTRRWLLAGLPALGILSAPAATVTWTGDGPDANWDTAANWNPGAPAAGDELVFPDTASFRDVNLNATHSPAKLHFTGTADYSFSGTGTLAGSGVTVEKDGSGWLTFGGANSFAGEVRIDEGLLAIAPTGGVTSALGAAGNTVTVAAGATLDLGGQGMSAQASAQAANRRYLTLKVAGQGIELFEGEFAGAITSTTNTAFAGYGKSGFQQVRLTADATAHAPSGVSFDLGFGPAGATANSSGSILSEGGVKHTLTKTGEGGLFIGGTSTTNPGVTTGYDLHIQQGEVTGFSAAAFGDQVTVDGGAVLRTGSALNVTVPMVLEDGAILSDFVGAVTFSGPLTLNGTPVFRATNTSNITIDTALDGPADVTVQRLTGSGNVIFAKDNVIDGSLLVSGTISAQLGTGGTTGSFKDDLGKDSPVNLSSGTLVLNRSDSFTYDAEITGTGTLLKSGGGTVRRIVPADFSRPGNAVVSVSAGSLLINNTSGHGTGDGNVAVSANATLGGTGSTAGPVLLGTANVAAPRAFLAPGDGPLSTGTFTAGGLQLASTGSGSLQFEVDGAAADKLVVNGDVVLGPAKIAEIAIAEIGGGATATTYTLLEYTGTLHGTFNSITGIPAGYRVRHDVSNKAIVLEQSSEGGTMPQVMFFDGGTVDLATTGDSAATATAGNWNSTRLNWDQGPVARLPWANDGSATAVLATGAYTVTVDDPAPLAVAGIKRLGATANLTVVTGGTLALQPGAPLHDAHVGTSDQGLRLVSKLTGSGGFTVTGRASSGSNHSRITLANPVPGDNTIGGPVEIAAGHLRLAASEQLGNACVVTANTAITGAVATLETGSGVNETVAGLHFGPNGGELKLGGSGASELTLDGGGLTLANSATFTYGNSASGIRFANAGEFVKSGDGNVTITRVNPANFIDLGGPRTIRVEGFGQLGLGVNLVNGALAKEGAGTLALDSDANTYQGNTTVAEGTLRLAHPTLYSGATLEVDSGALLDLGFASEETANVVKTFVVGGLSKPAGRYGPQGTALPGVTGIPEITGTGIIEVDPAWTPDPFLPWAMQIADPGMRDRTDDPDADGLDNFTEFAFDGDPASGAADGKVGVETSVLGGEHALVITLPVRTGAGTFTAGANGLVSAAIDGVIYRIQGSTDLSQWTLPLTEVTGTPGILLPAAPLSSGAWEYRSFRIDGPVSSRAAAFLRASAGE